ncbi:MAG TPA: O-antigen ligase family protein, partial [Thermoanaerobaculia bacterium]|nr:O-antigen ligase family protein [Thermoanaerobaculia bacterium]
MAQGTGDGMAGGRELLAPLGTLVALSLPFFVLTLASAEATRDAKLAAQAAGGVLVLLGLGCGRPSATREPASRGVRLALGAFLAFLALFAASAVAGLGRGRDPLDLLPLLPALALFAWGTTRPGEESAGRALALLVGCGALTGLLAALQRFAGLFRLPVEAPEPRFFATALIGNPGDVGASLVVPALLAAASLVRGQRRLAAALALAAMLAGLAAAATLAPLAAFGAGAAILVLGDLRRRLLPALGAALLLLGLLQAGGVLSRVSEKISSGAIDELTTQRDIGVLAALETIRAHPLLGVGPGGFSADFARARLAAEERFGRRLVHRSASAHFDNAHSDPLTVAAEAGLPAAA